MPILRSAFHKEKKMFSDVSEMHSRHNIVEITSSNPPSPILDEPSDFFGLAKNQELVDVLCNHGSYESEEGLQKRKQLINELDILVKQWIKSVSLGKGFSWNIVGGRIVTYGSYRLGAVGKEGDIDVLCVAPEHIDRSDMTILQHYFSQHLIV